MLAASAVSWRDTTKLGPALRGRLAAAPESATHDVYISVAGYPARDYLVPGTCSDFQPKIPGTIRAIKARCFRLQRSLLQYLNATGSPTDSLGSEAAVQETSKPEAFWINNIIKAELSVSAFPGLLSRSDVEHVELAQQSNQRDSLNRAQGEFTTRSNTSNDVRRTLTSTMPGKMTWSVQRVGAPHLWQRLLTGEGIVVAILDTGVNYRHPDLADHMWRGGEAFPRHGYNFDGEDHDPLDESGHGTCCAGIVAGDGKGGLVTGVAPQATIMAVRINNKETNCWKGMQFALENGAHVINQSLSWMPTQCPYYQGWRRACETVLATGVLHATSAGNKGDWQGPFSVPYNVGTPANCPPPWRGAAQPVTGGISSAIACGATDGYDFLDDDSSTGPCVWLNEGLYNDYPGANENSVGLIKPDVCAPAHTSTCNWQYHRDPNAEAYTSFGNTSSATAHLAGCLTLLAQACLRSKQAIVSARIQQALENTAVRIRGLQSNPARYQKYHKENGFGAGRIDVYAAYQYGMRKGWWL